MATWIKICGLKDPDHARLCSELSVDAVGLVYAPTSSRYVGNRSVDDLLEAAGNLTCVAVFGQFLEVDLSPKIQAVQSLSEYGAPELKDRTWIPVIRPVVDEFLPVPEAPMVILDAFSPHAEGGSGTRLDLDWAKRVMASNPNTNFALAGGINHTNVGEIIAQLRPFGVDVSSGVESAPGFKDEELIRRFIDAVRSAD